MKLGRQSQLDDVDRGILAVLQRDCRTALARIGEEVGMSAPSVLERIRKLEQAGVIRGYRAILDSRRVGLDVTAFIGVSIDYPRMIGSFEQHLSGFDELLECHHVTGAFSLLLKVKTWNTATLESLISRLRSIDGVTRTETMIVFSTRMEETRIPLDDAPPEPPPAALPSGTAHHRGAHDGPAGAHGAGHVPGDEQGPPGGGAARRESRAGKKSTQARAK